MMNNVEYIFRLVKSEEADNILAIYKSIKGTRGCSWHDGYPTMLEISSDIKTQSLYCLTEADGEIIAVATAGPLNELSDLPWDERMKNPCELARIGVLPSLQKRGIASALLRLVIEECKGRDYDGMRFLVSKTNDNALMLYQKFGFENVGEVSRYGFDFYRFYKLFEQDKTV